jgi:hypothetical protein
VAVANLLDESDVRLQVEVEEERQPENANPQEVPNGAQAAAEVALVAPSQNGSEAAAVEAKAAVAAVGANLLSADPQVAAVALRATVAPQVVPSLSRATAAPSQGNKASDIYCTTIIYPMCYPIPTDSESVPII